LAWVTIKSTAGLPTVIGRAMMLSARIGYGLAIVVGIVIGRDDQIVIARVHVGQDHRLVGSILGPGHQRTVDGL